jgi:putative DNA methylase
MVQFYSAVYNYDPAYRNLDGTVDTERAAQKRAELFNLIEELVRWENSNDTRILNLARKEIARCVASRKIELEELQKDTIIYGERQGQKHPNGPVSGIGVTAWDIATMSASPEVVNHFLANYAPPVLDPFAGGGSIPLEAQRLGLRAYASDLNPIPVLINKALIEIPPKFAGMEPLNPEYQSKSKTEKAMTPWQGAQGLAEDVRYYGQWMRDEAQKRIGHLYPKVKITQDMVDDGRPDLKKYLGQELTVIAWLWARTVASPDPSVDGVHVPLVRSFWLSKKKGKEAYVRPVVDRAINSYRFEVKMGKPESGFDPDKATVVRTGAECLISSSPLPFDHAREEGKAGRLGQKLMAIVCEGDRGRVYLTPTIEQEAVALSAHPHGYPETDIPQKALGFRVQLYGMDKHWKLFTNRQLTALCTFSDLVKEAREKVIADAGNVKEQLNSRKQAPKDYADAVATYLGLSLSRWSDLSNTICSWNNSNENVRALFSRQAIPMSWDFVELCPFSKLAPINSTSETIYKLLGHLVVTNKGRSCQSDVISEETYFIENVKQADATAVETYSMVPVISCDPPYYDNIGYADLSDFFYVWLRKTLREVYPELLRTMLTPKAEELIASQYRHGGRAEAAKFFEDGLSHAIQQWRKYGYPDMPTTIFYAFKQAESDDSGTASTGWETFLNGVIDAGFAITATWPMRTERGVRSVAIGTNALASSVILACVPRDSDAPIATRRQFIDALKSELPEALRRLQSGSIAPVDLAQAAIGPGMGVFSRYSRVIETDGEPMRVRTALSLINEVLDEVLAEQEGEFDSDTRWAVSWFEQYGVDEGPYGVAETLSRAKNTSVQGLVDAGILTARGGRVKLISRDDMPADWDPAADKRLTGWEAVQYLIRELDQGGEQAAAVLLKKLGTYSELVRDLAYRLYAICERKGWASEAINYNSLIVAWPEISRLSHGLENTQAQTKSREKSLFD